MSRRGAEVRVAVLWPQMSGYADAAFAALVDLGHDVLVVHRAAQPDAPFDDARFDRYERLVWDEEPDIGIIGPLVERFAPDALLMSGWHGNTFRTVLRAHEGRSVRILGMDNQWHGTPKQWLGRLTSRRYLEPVFDAALVSGDRQAHFARLLGFEESRILRGFCTADVPAFDRAAGQHSRRPTFLFTGRLVRDKGVDLLASAYARHRQQAVRPWDLVVAGAGPLATAFVGTPGVRMTGFVQPSSMPDLMAASGCLVLPSRFEPWGVVVHEAAAAGCLLICSDRVGAITSFVDDGVNGHVVPSGDVGALVRAMDDITNWSSERRSTGSRHGRGLASLLTPGSWAASLVDGVERIRSSRRGGSS